MREDFLREALKEAEKAYRLGEVPVGCVVVRKGEILSRAYNRTDELKDASAHAEILALREAAKVLGDWRLEGCELYVTLEPCLMCAYALILFRVERVVFGAPDIRHGGVMSLYNLLDDERFNHRVRWVYEPQEECGRLLREFFKDRRC